MSDYQFSPDLWPVFRVSDELPAYAEVQQMRITAEDDDTYTLRCIYGEKVYFVEHTRALAPGHCYSDEGAREVHISRCCEFHFDMMFGDDE